MKPTNDPCRNLWIAVIELAIKELDHPQPKVRRDCRRFFKGRWGAEVMSMAGLEPSAVRRRLREKLG